MINDYSTLQAAIADELARADLTAAIPTFIQLAEADFNRQLRQRQMQVMVTGSAAAGVITLPTDVRAIQALHVLIGQRYLEIHPLPPEALADQIVTGFPSGYVVVNGEIQLIGGGGSDAYRLLYQQTIPALSASNTQNWLILSEPGLYLYQALAHSAPYLKDDQRLLTWAQMAKAIRDGMKEEDDMTRYGNAPAMQSPVRCAP